MSYQTMTKNATSLLRQITKMPYLSYDQNVIPNYDENVIPLL